MILFLMIVTASSCAVSQANQSVETNATEGNTSSIEETSSELTKDSETTEEIETKPPKETTAETKNTTPKPYLQTKSGKYVFCSSGEAASGAEGAYQYKDYEELSLVSTTLNDRYYVDETKEKERTYNFNGKSIKLQYKGSYIYEKENKPLTSKYKTYDVYTDAEGNNYSILTENSQLINYVNTEEADTRNPISKETATQIANNFLTELIGTELLNSYTYYQTSALYNYYWVSYVKYFHGYPTSDEIIVRIHLDGRIAAYTGLRVSAFDNAIKSITGDDIANTGSELSNLIRNSGLRQLRILDTRIEVAGNGDMYVALYTVHGKEFQYGDVFYLKIDPSGAS